MFVIDAFLLAFFFLRKEKSFPAWIHFENVPEFELFYFLKGCYSLYQYGGSYIYVEWDLVENTVIDGKRIQWLQIRLV